MILFDAMAHFYSQLFSLEHTLTYTWQCTIGSKSVGKHMLVVVIQQDHGKQALPGSARYIALRF